MMVWVLIVRKSESLTSVLRIILAPQQPVKARVVLCYPQFPGQSGEAANFSPLVRFRSFGMLPEHLILNLQTSMKISEAFGPYLNFCQSERQVAPSTLAKYRDCFESWIRPTFGKKEVSEISRLAVLELRQAMVDKQLSVARQYSVIMFLKSLLKFCRSTLSIACLDPSEIKLPRRPSPQVEYLTNGEIRRVLDAIDMTHVTGWRLRALIEVFLSTGMRVSEALSLKRQQFDSGAKEAEIIGKGKRKRTAFSSQRHRSWVQHYLDRRVADHPAV